MLFSCMLIKSLLWMRQMNRLTLGSPVPYQQGPLHNHRAVITGLLLAEQLPRRGHYHLLTSSALHISTENIAVYHSVLGQKAPLLH